MAASREASSPFEGAGLDGPGEARTPCIAAGRSARERHRRRGKHGPGLTWSRWSHPVPVSMPVPAKLRGVVKGEHEHELGRGLDGNGGRGLSSGSRVRSSGRQGTDSTARATSSRPSTTKRTLSNCIFVPLTVCLSCQTHSVAAGKHEVSMVGRAARTVDVHDGDRGSCLGT